MKILHGLCVRKFSGWVIIGIASLRIQPVREYRDGNRGNALIFV